MPRRKHRPERTCIGCGNRDEQHKLIRLVVGAQGELKIDRLAAGRGGYLHDSSRCWQAVLKRKSVFRAFHMEIHKQAREQLVRELSEGRWE